VCRIILALFLLWSVSSAPYKYESPDPRVRLAHKIGDFLVETFGPTTALWIIGSLFILLLILWIMILFRDEKKSDSDSPTPTWYWWWPFESLPWPFAFPQDETVASFVKLYSVLGYSPCVDGSLEPGYEKLALYAIGPAVKHVALQLPNGKWTSKLGEHIEKIEHSLDGLAGHGTPVQFLSRARAGGPCPFPAPMRRDGRVRSC
jgi:hypothetical protein